MVPEEPESDGDSVNPMRELSASGNSHDSASPRAASESQNPVIASKEPGRKMSAFELIEVARRQKQDRIARKLNLRLTLVGVAGVGPRLCFLFQWLIHAH